MVLAGSYYYSICTNMEAEIQALLSGLVLLQEYGLQDYELIIETDSKMLADMIQYTYHEGNKVADSLANKGVSDMQSITYESTESIPMQMKLLMMHDVEVSQRDSEDDSLIDNAEVCSEVLVYFGLSICSDSLSDRLFNLKIDDVAYQRFCSLIR
ncbi:unnamed protein product [Ilex paraguariensis]|uniref:RNase H type-1 domain-containing protein n=1 Tax=Ilex paraguariensis TaxID=185542 RepID=A0ABC8UEE9_9AQUA